MKAIALISAGLLCFAAAGHCALTDPNPYASTGRFIRGTGDDPSAQSFVIALDFQKGVGLDDLGYNSAWFGGTVPWFARTAAWKATNSHFDAEYTFFVNDGF